MIELSSLRDVRRVGRLSAKPASLKVIPRHCAGVTFDEASAVLHKGLSTLRLLLGSAQAEKDHPDELMWLRAVEKANELNSFKQLKIMRSDAYSFLPKFFARTTLSQGITATLSRLTFYSL